MTIFYCMHVVVRTGGVWGQWHECLVVAVQVCKHFTFLDHAHIVCTRAMDVRTIHIYINIYQKNSIVQLTSVGLIHTRPDYIE